MTISWAEPWMCVMLFEQSSYLSQYIPLSLPLSISMFTFFLGPPIHHIWAVMSGVNLMVIIASVCVQPLYPPSFVFIDRLEVNRGHLMTALGMFHLTYSNSTQNLQVFRHLVLMTLERLIHSLFIKQWPCLISPKSGLNSSSVLQYLSNLCFMNFHLDDRIMMDLQVFITVLC